MLKENLCRVLSLFLCLALLGGCGGDSAPQGNSDEDITAAFEELLAADYEVYYLLFADGLPVDRAGERELDGALYYPVTSQRFPNREALKKRLEEVYAKEETVEACWRPPMQREIPPLPSGTAPCGAAPPAPSLPWGTRWWRTASASPAAAPTLPPPFPSRRRGWTAPFMRRQ